MSKGNLANTSFLKYYYDRSGNSAVQKYYHNSKRISFDTYQKMVDKHWNDGTDIKFSKIK